MTKDSDGTPIEEEGGYGTPTVEQELGGGDATQSAQPLEEQESAAESGDVAVPSADADLDESNTEDPDAGRPFSSEPTPDAAGIPDGSGTDLPESKSPKDRDDDTFDAG